MSKQVKKEISIRNSTADFLVSVRQNGEHGTLAKCRKFRHTADDGKNYQVNHYSLEAIVSVGWPGF